ncbi:uncharacterized protein EI90DRAFT_325474 [Cantharellus anzutake]|uniref:uncharacterized protein n=1 Tax=Cantharellus anzutake TaxID=1750568 RepID=UPI001907F193|nr:uncharacterized protein EI90DRAFT_325474 [Cantharellus anzutake]KAF8335377.1 hypothetical protein EI90DRAFT_325474 [Cantharellus anzutake]
MDKLNSPILRGTYLSLFRQNRDPPRFFLKTTTRDPAVVDSFHALLLVVYAGSVLRHCCIARIRYSWRPFSTEVPPRARKVTDVTPGLIPVKEFVIDYWPVTMNSEHFETRRVYKVPGAPKQAGGPYIDKGKVYINLGRLPASISIEYKPRVRRLPTSHYLSP